MAAISIFAPAKLNLFLAVTGKRTDGYHDLVSVVAPLDFGDTLQIEPAPGLALHCSDPAVPGDDSNLVLKAARAFIQAAADRRAEFAGATFRLEKRIPMGAGLGGGSSDAVAALRGLNRLAGPGRALAPEELAQLAAQLGSDCPLFLRNGPVILRGRGERIADLSPPVAARVRGRRVLIFKPGFGISTPWAYGRLAALAPSGYLPEPEAEARLSTWLDAPDAPVEELLFNNLEAPAFAKYLALPVLLAQLREQLGVCGRMSGSGSACFALLSETTDVGPIQAAIRAAWGESAWVIEARLT